MTAPPKRKVTLADRLRYRAWSLPHSLRELDRALLLLGTFRRVGWNASVRRGAPTDRGGRALPWLTYPAIFWLEGALSGSETVLEFGAGHSTIWLAQRVARVIAVEHDPAWVERIRARAPGNAQIAHRQCTGDELWSPGDDPYVGVVHSLAPGSLDLVMIDGLARNSCMAAAVAYLKEEGLLVLDNADRPAYGPGLELLGREGFGRIDFAGPGPGLTNFWCTSVLSRDFGPWVTGREPPAYWGAVIPDFGVV